MTCRALPVWSGMSVSTKSRDYSSKVLASCQDGYRFPGESQEMTAVCGEHGHWEPDIPDCERFGMHVQSAAFTQ